MAIRGNFWKGGRDWDDFVAEAGEPFGVQFHGKLRVERQVALLLAQFGPILRREWFGKVVGSEQDALSAGRKREHINVLDDRARQRLEVRDAFAAADFFELLVEIEVLILVAREKNARGEAAAVFQLEKISSVDGDSRSFVMEIGSGEDGVGELESGVFVVRTLHRSFGQNLRIFAEEIQLGVNGGKHSFAGFR